MKVHTASIAAALIFCLLAACSQAPAPSNETISLVPETSVPSKSSGGGQIVNVRFLNKRAKPVEYLWRDFDGGLKSYGVIEPSGDIEQQTYPGHVWVFQEGSQPLGASVATNPGKTVLIN